MSDKNQEYTEKRSAGRRKEDRTIRDRINKHDLLFQVGQIITSTINIDEVFNLIIEQTNQFMNTERCSVFMYDEKNEELWSLVATDLGSNEIRIPTSYGVVGWVFQQETPLMLNDPYKDPRFYPDVDKKTGFRTRNILCIPLINREQKCIGTLEILNNKEGDFIEYDLELLTSASHYFAIALENAKLYEDLKVLDKAKERVINHLSHELKTPLAIITAVLEITRKKIVGVNISGMDKTLDRGERNVRRLIDLQTKIDDILNQKSIEEKDHIMDLIESAAGIVEEIKEGHEDQHSEILGLISDRLESLFSISKILKEKIRLGEFLHSLCDYVMDAMGDRKLNIVRKLDDSIRLSTDRDILEKVCEGMLKNAIENTPDEGIIEVVAKIENSEIWIEFHDHGVGITSENQKMIFGGFFHTQDTRVYSSKRPYEFNAGGTGSDLLRTKVFSERVGFSVDFKSSRCQFLPKDDDLCPGKISICRFIKERSECLSTGSSVFSIKFPLEYFKD
jgi:signal transduction histidine kinase